MAFFLLTVQICYAIIVTDINRNLSAVPTAVILKLSGSVMRIFQYTGFRKLIAVNQNLSVSLFVSSSLYRLSDVDFHWARGANARGRTTRRGKIAPCGRSFSPLLKVLPLALPLSLFSPLYLVPHTLLVRGA